MLAGLVGVQVAGIAGFALSGWLWPALGAIWLRDAARVIAEPVQAAWLNRSIDARSRATTLSLVSQLDALGQVAGGPPLGALATRTTIRAGLLASALVLAPAAVVLLRLRRRDAEPGVRPAGGR